MDVGRDAFEQAAARFSVCCGCLAAFWLPVYLYLIILLGRQPLLSLALDLSVSQPVFVTGTHALPVLLLGVLLLGSFFWAYHAWLQRERYREHYGLALRDLLSIAQELNDERGVLEAEWELQRIQRQNSPHYQHGP